eukprot:CAMPEP_0182428162 /NCGR_PEP_ID=MMETSP1167-20130531/21067_1 /TAXON_ID=2988 /ORGANISM="Mallomonas Sp, Strain CCMP3275" /LENGTH=222 /DNA_ID=CAMNT_0024610865 /DNA_START=170 /DNA_END=838 /DNA_ORIENTATION=+
MNNRFQDPSSKAILQNQHLGGKKQPHRLLILRVMYKDRTIALTNGNGDILIVSEEARFVLLNHMKGKNEHDHFFGSNLSLFLSTSDKQLLPNTLNNGLGRSDMSLLLKTRTNKYVWVDEHYILKGTFAYDFLKYYSSIEKIFPARILDAIIGKDMFYEEYYEFLRNCSSNLLYEEEFIDELDLRHSSDDNIRDKNRESRRESKYNATEVEKMDDTMIFYLEI